MLLLLNQQYYNGWEQFDDLSLKCQIKTATLPTCTEERHGPGTMLRVFRGVSFTSVAVLSVVFLCSKLIFLLTTNDNTYTSWASVLLVEFNYGNGFDAFVQILNFHIVCLREIYFIHFTRCQAAKYQRNAQCTVVSCHWISKTLMEKNLEMFLWKSPNNRQWNWSFVTKVVKGSKLRR